MPSGLLLNGEHVPNLQRLQIQGRPKHLARILLPLRCRQLRHLTLGVTACLDELPLLATPLAALPKLGSLDLRVLSRSGSLSNVVAVLPELAPLLTAFSLEVGSDLTNQGLADEALIDALANCPRLSQLALARVGMNEAGACKLAKLEHLVRFEIAERCGEESWRPLFGFLFALRHFPTRVTVRVDCTWLAVLVLDAHGRQHSAWPSSLQELAGDPPLRLLDDPRLVVTSVDAPAATKLFPKELADKSTRLRALLPRATFLS